MVATNFVQWGPYQGAAIESSLALFGKLTSQIEKMTRLQLDDGAEATREALAASQAFAEIRDASGFASWQETYLQPGLERATERVRRQYALVLESRNVVLEAFKEASSEVNQQVKSGIDRLAEKAPGGFEPIFEALRKSLEAQASALENVSRVSEQFSEIADANVAAVKSAVTSATKSGVQSKRKVA